MSQIEITPTLLSDLRQKAEAATIEYDWKLHDDQKNWPVIQFGNRPGEDCGGFTIKGNYSPKLIQDAAHIAAASPAVVLALVAEVERLRGTQDELAETLSDVLRHTDLSGWKLGEQIEKDATDLLKRIKEASNADQA